MAAIDYFGNTIRVTAAGTVTHESVEISSLVVWSANSSASLILGEAGSSGSEVLRFSTDKDVPLSTSFHGFGRYQQLSFNIVTACTAYLNLR